MKLISKLGIVLTLIFAVLVASGCASTGSSDAVVPDDDLIASDVRDAIMSRPGLEDQGIVVSSVGGVVTLIGQVESSIERTLALRVAEGVAGVVSVQNELTTQ